MTPKVYRFRFVNAGSKARSLAQLSQAELAGRLGVSRHEQGLRCPDGYGYLYGYMGNFWCCLDPPY